MPVTAQDWRVTAEQQVRLTVEHVTHAHDAENADLDDVLRDCWRAFRASGAAVGAWAQSLLADGRSWEDVGAALDLSGAQAQVALEPLISQAEQHVRERLPNAVAGEQPSAPDSATDSDPAAGAASAAGSRSAPARVLVLNGPNLNLLGTREPGVYGVQTLDDVERLCRQTAAELGLDLDFRQTNHEGVLIDAVHEARRSASAIVINPAGYSHTSVALMDALAASDLPVVEVHLSNVHRREPFRHVSYVSKVADAVVAGCGPQGYALALRHAAALLGR